MDDPSEHSTRNSGPSMLRSSRCRNLIVPPRVTPNPETVIDESPSFEAGPGLKSAEVLDTVGRPPWLSSP